MSDARNVLGSLLQVCSVSPMTGFVRDGLCRTGPEDMGSHTVCVQMTDAFLQYSLSRGNDLVTAVPEYDFPGLQAGDRWCMCATRWLGPADANFMPATRSIRNAAREAGRAAVSFTASGSRQREAPESARPFGLPREGASAALHRLARRVPLPARCALHPSLSRGNAGMKLTSAGPGAAEDGVAPPVVLVATHERALKHIALADLAYHALRDPERPSQNSPAR